MSKATMPKGHEAVTQNQRQAGKPPTLPQPQGRGAPRIQADPLAVLHTPEPKEDERIRDRDTHRLTPVSKAFVCQCILAGCSNTQVNLLLRRKGFILEAEADLSDETLRRVRGRKECALDPEQLSLEARQVGHNSVSTFTLYWAELGTEAFERLRVLLAGGAAGEGMSASEALRVAVNATRFILGVYAAGLPARIRAEVEAALAGAEGGKAVTGVPVPLPPAEQMAEYVEVILASAYERCRAAAAQECGMTLEEYPLPAWVANETGQEAERETGNDLRFDP